MSPPFDLKWFAITITSSPLNVNSAAKDFLVPSNADASVAIRPGLLTKCPSASTVTDSVELPFIPAFNVTLSGLYKKPTRMFPPGAPPSSLLIGLISVHL